MTRARGWWVPALLLTAAPALAGLLPAAPSSAAQQICVAVVVDFRALGGNVTSSCATVPDGATGTQVLKAAGHAMTFRRDGLICTIDGQPAQGCSASDDSHYWSYWHRPAGSNAWQYSSEGPGTYQPPNRASEGWVWQDGGPEGSDPPPDIAESQICPPAAPTTAPRATAKAPAPAASAAAAAAPVPAPHPATGSPVPTPAAGTAAHPTSAPPAPAATTATATPSPVSRSATATARPNAAANADGAEGSGGFPTGLVVGIVAAVALGGAALARARR